MPGTVEELIAKLRGLPQFVRETTDLILRENDDDIIDLNKAQMLVAGVDADSDQLGEYSPFTVQERRKKGLQTDFIDLRFTGKFQDEMELKRIRQNEYEISSDDPKWDSELRQQWPDALGLTDDNEERITVDIVRILDRNVDNYLSVGKPSRPRVNV